MKIKIHQSDLIKALNIVEKALSSKNVIESLKGIKISVNDSYMTFITSKSEMAIEYKINLTDIDITVENVGEMIVPGFHFINIIRKLNTNYIKLEKDKNKINIHANNSFIELIGFDSNSYPEINFSLKDSQVIEINKQLLIDTYTKTKYAISTDPINQILTGVNYNFKNNKLAVSSTDSLRIIYYKFDYPTDEEVKFTINKSLLQDVNKIFSFVDEEKIQMEITDNQCLISSNSLKVKTRLLDGAFPNVEKIIPTTSSFSYNINKQDMLEALQRVLLLNERNENPVVASIKDNSLLLSSHHKFLGAIEEYCNITQFQGSCFNVGFDPKFVIDALHTINEDEAHFEFTDEISGFVIRPKSDESIINIISPIRLT